jgi:phage terminase large subunit-like protein
VGDTVRYRLKLASDRAHNVTAKLLLKWSEPLVIARMVRPNVVLLENPATVVNVRRAHVSQLKPYVK